METEEGFNDFACFELEEPETRKICSRCQRPETVCFCDSIVENLKIRHKILMLQHPMEVRRCLRTTRILELSLSSENYHLFRGKRFFRKHFAALYSMLRIEVPGYPPLDIDETANDVETILVFPSENAVSLSELDTQKRYQILFIDGTWTQAKTMYNTNEILRSLRAVKLDSTSIAYAAQTEDEKVRSRYVIRTQPTDGCLSTVEAVAIVLAQLERDPQIYDALTRPLEAICDYQLDKGAVVHESKQYLIENGLYKKQINRGMLKKLENNNCTE